MNLKKNSLFKDKSILLVDDEAGLRAVLEFYLENYGAKIHQVDNGQEALNFLEKHPNKIDLIISDQMMPELKGSEFLKVLRDSASPYKDTKFLLMSGGACENKDDMETIKNLSNGYIEKPFDFNYLDNVFKKMMLTKSAA